MVLYIVNSQMRWGPHARLLFAFMTIYSVFFEFGANYGRACPAFSYYRITQIEICNFGYSGFQLK